jgi:hypothetical protein
MAATRLIVAALMMLPAGGALGHEAITGWSYPAYCCGEGDCGHATAAHRNPDGSLTVTPPSTGPRRSRLISSTSRHRTG